MSYSAPFDPEWQLLKVIAAGTAYPDVPPARIDADRLVALALRHQMAAALTDFLRRRDMLRLIPWSTVSQLLLTARAVRHRTRLFVAEAAMAVEALSRAGVRVACTKGIIFQSTLYDGSGTRFLGDIDMMTDADSGAAVADTLAEIGYLAKVFYDNRREQFIDIPRADLAVYSFFPDHLPHLHRPVDDPVVAYHRIDVAFTLTWYGSPWQVPMDAVMAQIRPVAVQRGDERVTLPALSPAHSFLFAVLHVFREGWFTHTVQAKDLKLPQFGDLVRFWDRLGEEGRASVGGMVDAYGVAEPVAWVCHHTDALFGTGLVAGLDLSDAAGSEWTGTASGVDGVRLGWHGDMDVRLRTSGPPEMWKLDDDGGSVTG